ncbi:MAG: hypothetical protein ABSG05_03590 [Candidatus Pacearchaeota archaeon]|jgi:hypothetical protein
MTTKTEICSCGHERKEHKNDYYMMGSQKIVEEDVCWHKEGNYYNCSCKKFTPQTPEDKKPKVFIERAEPLTIEGIRAICMNDEDYAKYRKDKTSGDFCLSDKILSRVNQVNEHFKELDKRKLPYDIRERALMTSLPLVIQNDVKEFVRRLKSKFKDGCGMGFTWNDQDATCGDDFEYEGKIKVILCSTCLEKIKEIDKLCGSKLSGEKDA